MVKEGAALESLPWEVKAFDGLELPNTLLYISSLQP
jgi:hypothetical protein